MHVDGRAAQAAIDVGNHQPAVSNPLHDTKLLQQIHEIFNRYTRGSNDRSQRARREFPMLGHGQCRSLSELDEYDVATVLAVFHPSRALQGANNLLTR